jgi:hypothetical protein
MYCPLPGEGGPKGSGPIETQHSLNNIRKLYVLLKFTMIIKVAKNLWAKEQHLIKM